MLSPVVGRLQCRKLTFTQCDIFAKLARALFEIVRAIAFETVAHSPQFMPQRGQFLPESLFNFHAIDYRGLGMSKV